MLRQFKRTCCGVIAHIENCEKACFKCGSEDGICEEVPKRERVFMNPPPYSGDKGYEKREWGNFSVLLDEEGCKVKKIVVKPNQRLSLQLHTGRDEYWTVVRGVGWLHVSGKEYDVEAGDFIRIKKYETHRIENNLQEDLVFIEVQLGLCNENDIVRIEDDYGRA